MITYIYFIQAGHNGPIKIGVSDNPRKRFASLQVGHYETLTFLGAVETDAIIENRLHRVLEGSRVRGEWFRSTKEVMDTIAELLSVTRSVLETIPISPLKNLEIKWPEQKITGDIEPLKKRLLDAIEAAKGNLTSAAQMLGYSRKTIQNHMRLCGIPRGRGGRPRKLA